MSVGVALAISALASPAALRGLGRSRRGCCRLVRCLAGGGGGGPAAEEGRPRVVFVIGGPGSGKGTQCERIAREFGHVHLSAGELLRAERRREGSTLGAEIEEVIRSGGVVRSEVIATLLEQAMREAGWGSSSFVIDGYPRSGEQLRGWEATLGSKVDLVHCISIEVGCEEMRRRLLGRAESSGRLDDNAETIDKRFVTYEEETGPLLEHFESEGLLRRVDGERSVEEVWGEVRGLLAPVEELGGDSAAKDDVKSFLLDKA